MARPSKYRPEFAKQAEKLCLLGATDRELAHFFDVTTVTIWNWQSAHPEFFNALKRGKAVADERVERALYSRATGYSYESEKLFCSNGEVIRAQIVEHIPPSDTACIFWLKNRKPREWRDRVQASIDMNMPAMSSNMSLEESQAAFRQMLDMSPEDLARQIKLIDVPTAPEDEDAT